MSDVNTETPQTRKGADATQDIIMWMKKPLTVTAPTWAFLIAGLVALGLLGVALD